MQQETLWSCQNLNPDSSNLKENKLEKDMNCESVRTVDAQTRQHSTLYMNSQVANIATSWRRWAMTDDQGIQA